MSLSLGERIAAKRYCASVVGFITVLHICIGNLYQFILNMCRNSSHSKLNARNRMPPICDNLGIQILIATCIADVVQRGHVMAIG